MKALRTLCGTGALLRGVASLLLALALAAGPAGTATAAPRPATAATAPAGTTCRAPAAPARAGHVPVVHGAILGDRQRMVQVAMICMGVAILILTRGNKF